MTLNTIFIVVKESNDIMPMGIASPHPTSSMSNTMCEPMGIARAKDIT